MMEVDCSAAYCRTMMERTSTMTITPHGQMEGESPAGRANQTEQRRRLYIIIVVRKACEGTCRPADASEPQEKVIVSQLDSQTRE